MADKSVSPWAVVKRLLRSGRPLSIANQSSLPYSESCLRLLVLFLRVFLFCRELFGQLFPVS